MNTTILKPIGKGQFTIPKAWRKLLNIENKPVQAHLESGRIIIKPLENKVNLDIEFIVLNTLSKSIKTDIETGRNAYKNKKSEQFLSFEEVFSDV